MNNLLFGSNDHFKQDQKKIRIKYVRVWMFQPPDRNVP